jgi:hypothetical protein
MKINYNYTNELLTHESNVLFYLTLFSNIKVLVRLIIASDSPKNMKPLRFFCVLN